MMFTQNKGLVGLDKARPLGLILQTEGVTPQGGVCLPVTDLKQLLDNLQAFGIAAEDQGNGIMYIYATNADHTGECPD